MNKLHVCSFFLNIIVSLNNIKIVSLNKKADEVSSIYSSALTVVSVMTYFYV